jgi:pimeloyl-ACP methyl ester carboxylesterase
MIRLRTYGLSPFTTAVVHGGPGACGELAPVARGLSSACGVLEPVQTKASVHGQVEELKSVLENHGTLPSVLIGHSWGAWLCYILAALHPSLVKKLVLVSSPPFEESYAAEIPKTRRARLDPDQRAEWDAVMKTLEGPHTRNSAPLENLKILTTKTDAFEPVPDGSEPGDALPFQAGIYERVWKEAAGWRSSGRLLELGRHIACPVTAFHGSYDPHPAEGVRLPLSGVVRNFRFIMLDHCGHRPWAEARAKRKFYKILLNEIA